MFFFVLLGIGLLGGIAVVAAGRGEALAAAPADRAPLVLVQDRPLVRSDVDGLRFSVGLRGYRMDEVDDVLDRLATDIEFRDHELVRLRAQLGEPVADPTPLAEPVARDQPTERTMVIPLDSDHG